MVGRKTINQQIVARRNIELDFQKTQPLKIFDQLRALDVEVDQLERTQKDPDVHGWQRMKRDIREKSMPIPPIGDMKHSVFSRLSSKRRTFRERSLQTISDVQS